MYLIALVIGAVIGIVIMRAANTFKGTWGRTPWGIPSWAWFIIGFIFGVIGAILYLISQATTKRSLSRAGAAGPQYGSMPPAYPPPPVPPPDPQSWAPPAQSPLPPPPPPPADGTTN
jgi:Na+/melibiose symporter-like transporter